MATKLTTFLIVITVRIIFGILLKHDWQREIVLLRKENEILRRGSKRPAIQVADRIFFVSMFRASRDLIRNIGIVKPETVVRWHRELAAKRWKYGTRSAGRPEIPAHIKKTVVEMKTANPRWGLRKIQMMLRKLGVSICRESIRKILKESNLWFPPEHRAGRSWYQFLRDHCERFFAADFFTVDTLFFQRLYVFFIVEFPSRRIVQVAVTRNPTQCWLERVLLHAFPGEPPPTRVMVTDRDKIYGDWLKVFLEEMLDIKLCRTPPGCPFYNPFAERMVRTFREEVLDHVLIWDAGDLHRILSEYIHYYNSLRSHWGLNGDAPERSFDDVAYFGSDGVRRKEILNGLITDFYVAA